MSNEEKSSSFTTAPRGAQYTTIHQERQVKVYPIQEHELRTIGVLSTQFTVWCSIGSICAALLLGCIWDITQIPEGEKASASSWAFIFGCVCVIVLSISLCLKFHWDKTSQLEQILEECS